MYDEISNQRSANRELERRLVAAFAEYGARSLKDVQVEAISETVRLRGRVRTFYAKQIAYHIATRFAGTRRVADDLDVLAPSEYRSPCGPRKWAVPAALMVALVVSLSGCSKAELERLAVHPVKGQVTYNGRPAVGAFVVFHPKQELGGAVAPSAKVDSQGNYELTTYVARDGAPVGEYAVTVVLRPLVKKNGDFEPGPNILPPHTSKPATSKIVAKIAEGSNTVPITIAR